MTKNPILNALAAGAYITAIALFMTYGSQLAGPDDTIMAPIAFISLFTLSAAIMGYLFFYQPVLLFIENKRKEAVNLFLKTLLSFGVITFIFLLLLFSRIMPKI